MPAPASEPSLVDDLLGMLDDPMIMYGAIGLLVLIIGFVVYKKRQSSGGFEESILNVGDGGLGATAESMEDSNESSMVSDFAMSEMSGMSGISADAADVDPVSEADVYLAYGRHQQAEEILNEALASDPNRHDVKLKLLEVFFAAKNSDGFEKGAQELHDALGDESDPLWAKAVTMGQQLCPNSALFGGTEEEASQEDSSTSADESPVSDVAEASEDDLLDFDFDIDSAGDDEGIDDVFAELEAATAGTDVADDSDSGEADDTALDLETPVSDDTAAPSDDEKAEDDDHSLDFDVSDLSLDSEDSDDKPEETSEADTGLDFDMGDSEPDVAETATESKDDFGDLNDDAFGEVDEVGTKLDLAKAYVDMGDSDGARSILDEVMEEGDESQKAQAKELLGALG
jgi:pilus assembly protein FimV